MMRVMTLQQRQPKFAFAQIDEKQKKNTIGPVTYQSVDTRTDLADIFSTNKL
jgi:hypothetical protein